MKKARKLLALIMAAVLMLTAVSVTSFADVYDDAVAIDSGETVTEKVDNGCYLSYEFTSKSSGTLTLSWSVASSYSEITVFDEDGSCLNIEEIEVKSGSIYSGGVGKNYIEGKWNSSSERFAATAKYKVSKGTYYIKIYRGYGNSGSGTVKLTATYPTKSAKDFSYLGITLKKGDTMQLQAVDADSSQVTWKSSKKSVASVTSKGKITAKKKGTTIISCTYNGVTVKLKVTVTA